MSPLSNATGPAGPYAPARSAWRARLGRQWSRPTSGRTPTSRSRLTSCYTGATIARGLGRRDRGRWFRRLLCRPRRSSARCLAQSTRITLVNDVNFLLYTPFLPEAAAGTLEPRHVVTPLRDVLGDTRLRLGVVDRPRCRAADRDDARPGRREHELRYDQLVLALGSVSRVLPIPGLDEHAVGFKSLADAIWLRNHVIECLELADATDDPAAARGAAHLPLRRWRLRRAGGARRAPGLRRRGDASSIRGRACTACAGCWSRRRTACCPRSTPSWPSTRCASCAAAGSTSGWAPRSRRSRPTGTDLDRRDDPDAHGRLDRGGRAPSEQQEPRPAARRSRADRRGRSPARAGRGRRLGARRCAAVPTRRRPAPSPARPPPSTRSGRARRPARNVAASLGVGQRRPFSYRRWGQFVNLGRYQAVAKVRRRRSGASRPGGLRAPTT